MTRVGDLLAPLKIEGLTEDDRGGVHQGKKICTEHIEIPKSLVQSHSYVKTEKEKQGAHSWSRASPRLPHKP